MGGRVVEPTSPTSIGTPVPFSRYWRSHGTQAGETAVSSAVFSAQRSSGVSSALSVTTMECCLLAATAAAFGLATPAKTQLEGARWVLDLVAS